MAAWIVQTCVLHLIRNTFRFASKADWDKMARDLRPVYTAVSEHEAKERFVEFGDIWSEKYPVCHWSRRVRDLYDFQV